MKKSTLALSIFCMVFSFSTASLAAAGSDRLYSDEVMFRWEYLTSKNGRFALFFSVTELVLYDNSQGIDLWSAPTSSLFQYLYMNPNGNVEAIWAGYTLWQTNTSGNPGSLLVLQDDGNLVVYSPGSTALWNSGTWGH
jgi:hypothetical protein